MDEQDKSDRIKLFLKEYEELTVKHKVDFINFPMWVPEQKSDQSPGQGGWRLVIQTQPVDTTDQPVKSPFIA